jgi:multidrug resistance protein, MATE family
VTVAANAVLHNLVLLGTFFLEGITTAAEQLCGQAFGARDVKSFCKAVRLTGLWCFVFAAGFTLAALLLGGISIDFLTTNPQVRAYAHDCLAFAALMPLAGVLAFELDGVFIGATWTRDMRNVMVVSLGIYLASFYLLRPFGNGGLWVALAIFYLSRGLNQAWRYRKLSAESFPLAQSATATPVASASLRIFARKRRRRPRLIVGAFLLRLDIRPLDVFRGLKQLIDIWSLGFDAIREISSV